MTILTLLLTLSGLLPSLPDTSEQSLQVKRIGLPFITSYTQLDHDMSNENLDVLLASDNRIYFGNEKGVLIYDGLNWTKVILPNEGAVYGLEQDQNGTVYVGGVSEIGYLATTPNGEVHYITLMDQVAGDSLESFATMPIFDGDHQMIFRCMNKTVIVETNTMKTEVIDNPPMTPHASRGKLYATSKDSLYQLIDKQWVAQRSSVIGAIWLGAQILVDVAGGPTIAVTQRGLYNFDTEELIPISQELKDYLKNSTTYRVDLIKNKYLVLSNWNGLMITDLKGEIIMHLTEEKGLSSNFVLATTLDQSGMLWIATNNGIDRIDLFSPYTLFDERIGVSGVVKSATVFNNSLYLASISGIFSEDWSTLNDPMALPQFTKENANITHGHIESDDNLIFLTGTKPNLFLKNGELKEVEGTEGISHWRGMFLGDDVLLGTLNGQLAHLEKVKSTWKVKARHDPAFKSVHHMVRGAGNTIWVSNINEGMFKLVYDMEAGKLLSEKKYEMADGLPSDLNNAVFSVNEKPFFTTEKGIYTYDEKTDSFSPDEYYSSTIGQAKITLLAQDEQGTIYYYSDHLFRLNQANELEQLPDINFKKYVPQDIHVINAETVLIPTLGSVVHFNPKNLTKDAPYKTRITKLASLQRPDSARYAGFGEPVKNLLFDDSDHDLSIQFAADYFNNEQATEYQWRLIGDNEEWSDWSSNNHKEYTNLPHGKFTFEVRAKNYLGNESEPTSISFRIATPWFYSLWAYFLYSCLFIALVWAIVKIYTRKIRADRDRLEAIVVERTQEINQQKLQAEENAATISQQHDKLVKMDDMKSRFFINISHELRTPLTLAMGTVERALNGTFGALNPPLKENLDLSRRNSRRLLKMVNNILDISKLESSSYEIQVSRTLISARLLKVLDYFSSRFHNKNITISNRLSSEAHLYIDPEKFETIFINIIGNAFKFTPNGGNVTITDKEDDQWVHITISDTGVGIPADSIPFVFDRFYQNPDQVTDQGTGLGLALCKELVELHHGKVAVSSEHGEGSTFTVSFQKGSDHFRPDQIVINSSPDNLEKDIILPDDLTAIPIALPNRNDGAPHILVVEDNSEMSRFIAEILAEDYQVSIAENGQKGLEFLAQNQPDLILTDYLMPEMDGFEMATKIKQTKEHLAIPMIFLTARAEEQDRVNVLNLGVDDYLAKPFSSEELLARIKNLIAAKSRREEFIEEQDIDSSEIEWTEFNSKLKTNLDQYISENIKNEITALQLAEYMGQSIRNLNRKVKAGTGFSLAHYVKEYRLRKARTLLENQEMHTVSEVSYAVGFNYLSHFTKSYKERFGKQPSEYLE